MVLIETYAMGGLFYFVIRNKSNYKMLHSSKFYKTREMAKKAGELYARKFFKSKRLKRNPFAVRF